MEEEGSTPQPTTGSFYDAPLSYPKYLKSEVPFNSSQLGKCFYDSGIHHLLLDFSKSLGDNAFQYEALKILNRPSLISPESTIEYKIPEGYKRYFFENTKLQLRRVPIPAHRKAAMKSSTDSTLVTTNLTDGDFLSCCYCMLCKAKSDCTFDILEHTSIQENIKHNRIRIISAGYLSEANWDSINVPDFYLDHDEELFVLFEYLGNRSAFQLVNEHAYYMAGEAFTDIMWTFRTSIGCYDNRIHELNLV